MSDYGIIAQILEDRYKSEAAMNPFIAGAGAMGESMPAYTGNKWWEGLAQGMLYGGTKGFMLQKGKNDLDAQSAEEEQKAARFTKLWSQDPENPEVQAMLAEKNPVISKLASRLELLKASEAMDAQSSGRRIVDDVMATKLVTPLRALKLKEDEITQVRDALIGQPEYLAKSTLEQFTKSARGAPDLMKERAAAQAEGTLGGKEGFRGDRGYLSEDAGKAVAAALTELKSNKLATSYNELEAAYEKAKGLKGTAIGDYLRQVLTAKAADPGTAAREGEVAAIENARAILDKWQGWLQKNVGGKGTLTDENRAEILSAIKTFRDVGARAYNEGVLRPNVTMVRERGGLPALAGFTPRIPAEYIAEYKPIYDDVRKAVVMQQEGKLEDLQSLSNMYMNKGIDQMFNPSDMAAAIDPSDPIIPIKKNGAIIGYAPKSSTLDGTWRSKMRSTP